MTGPEGDRYHGWWRITAVDAPKHFSFEDGFADADGNPNAEMPTTTCRRPHRGARAGRTRMTIESTFPRTEAMQQLLTMGMEEGIAAAIGQIDGILAG